MSLPSLAVLTDRSIGAILSGAVGDALGAPYAESTFLPAKLEKDAPVELASSGQGVKGKWTANTGMAIPVIEAMGKKLDLGSAEGRNHIAQRWLDQNGQEGMPDPMTLIMVETQTSDAFFTGTPISEVTTKAAAEAHKTNGKSNQNTVLPPVVPLALAYLKAGQEAALVSAVDKVAQMISVDQDARDAAALLSLGVRNAILTGSPDFEAQTKFLAPGRGDRWVHIVRDAESLTPDKFKAENKTAVYALKAAISANNGAKNLKEVLEKAVRAGGETGTVASVAGSIAGAKFGSTEAMNEGWDKVHGWPYDQQNLPYVVQGVISDKYEA